MRISNSLPLANTKLLILVESVAIKVLSKQITVLYHEIVMVICAHGTYKDTVLGRVHI